MNKKDAKLKIKSRYNVIFDFLYNHAITLLIIILKSTSRNWNSNINWIFSIFGCKNYLQCKKI